MSTKFCPRLTLEEYLAIERAAENKSEFVDGEMYALSGATFAHTVITMNLAAGLHARLRNKPCTVHSADLKVRVEATGLHAYERILCGNMANAARWETYVIKGPRGSRAIELNGAVALLGKAGDRITIMSFTEVDAARASGWEPRVIVLDQDNRVVSSRGI